MRRRTLPRRHLLRGLGSVTLGLPLLDAMTSLGGRLPRAQAAGAIGPRRVILFYTANGFHLPGWTPARGAGEDFTLSPILEPFAPIRDECLFIDGVPMSSSYDSRARATGHPGGAGAVFTGSYAGPGNMFGGAGFQGAAGYPITASVDQIIASRIGRDTRFAAYHLGVRTGRPELASRVFYSQDRQPISAEEDPDRVRSQILGQLPGTPGHAARARQRQTVVDAVRSNFAALRARLGPEDRARLDQHLAGVEEIDRRLGLAAAAGPRCREPDRGAAPDRSTFASAPALLPAMIDLLALAFACDLTRVVGLQFHKNNADSGGQYSWLGHGAEHHTLSHNQSGAREQLIQISRWHAEQLVHLVRKLKAIPEGDATVWDSTVVLWGSELGHGGSHSRKDTVWTILGGRRYFRTGRHVTFPGDAAHAHNRLLLHLLHYAGLPAASVGAPGYSEGGPLPGLTV